MFHTYIQGNNQFSKKKAFTLVEMLIVVVIIGILAAALIPRLVGAQSQARDVARKKHLADINGGLMMFYNDKGIFPDGDCTYDLSRDYETIRNHTNYSNQNLISGGYVNNIPRDPQINKIHPMNRAQSKCGYGYYSYRGIYNGTSFRAGFILMANMENYKNLNYILPTPINPGYGYCNGLLYFEFCKAEIINNIRDNFCNQGVVKGIGACKTHNINSGVYLYLGYPNAQ